jgi:flagellar L-ring protein FlgH
MRYHTVLAIGLMVVATFLAGCGRLADVGRRPDFNPVTDGNEFYAMNVRSMPVSLQEGEPGAASSLWSGGRQSLLGDRRAVQRGDILTVVIEIDESAEISNSTNRSRSGSEQMGVPNFFGIAQRIDRDLPDGASMGNAVDLSSSGQSAGQGSVRRNEQLTLRIAATVTDVLPNGVMRIEGSQEVRVNFELRELLVSGYVRPADISRQNEITYDKIASARISYGGRGQINDVQQPRYGQQVADILLPF